MANIAIIHISNRDRAVMSGDLKTCKMSLLLGFFFKVSEVYTFPIIDLLLNYLSYYTTWLPFGKKYLISVIELNGFG